ncbi:primase C-terminal domain-containing protein [Fictibacillus sp. BK138]|uniref:primase C-terminal domain-containing protein n=1 Tax=Fictibacillus sp. BK138 TaxID=2512121 RepID=UPI0010293747|nr:primase C-terminal domain-containing protein [Fictibacillus sp. BK138]RZT15580.1 primase-like protein [Fictibacillus sp. BK138]
MEKSALKHKKQVSISDILSFLTHDSLDLYKKRGTSAPIRNVVRFREAQKNAPYKKGVVFVSSSKEDLSCGRGYVVTSYETLEEKYKTISHWTPNTYRGGTYYDFKNRIIKGHTRDNLKQINVIGMDIDTKDVDLYGFYIGCEELGLPRPNLLLATPRGYQVFFVLSTPFYITKNHDYKSLRIAERISLNMRKALCEYAPVDVNCVPFGFYRIPKEENVLDFYPVPVETNELMTWSREYEKKNMFRVIYSNNSNEQNLIGTDWYQTLIRSEHIDSGHTAASRNNALLTLSLANYVSGRNMEEAYDELDQFNSNLSKPLSKQEFERTLKSAYSGKYKGVKRSYVEQLLELWTEGNVKFTGREGWYKFKKPREERTRSHYNEREEDVINYLKVNTSETNPYLEGSLKLLAETFGMAVSTLKEVLKQSKNLVKRTIGRGRNAVTQIAARSILFHHIIELKQLKNQKAQFIFQDVLQADSSRFVNSIDHENLVSPYYGNSSPPKARSS